MESVLIRCGSKDMKDVFDPGRGVDILSLAGVISIVGNGKTCASVNAKP